MIVLGIDCATKNTNIGLIQDKEVLGEFSEELGRKQAQKLPFIVEDLLTKASVSLNDINYISVTNGPGYYTGIRTGIAYSGALGEALGIKIIPISTMLSFVYDLRKEYRYLAPVIKARQLSLYCALYKFNDEYIEEIIKPSFCKAKDFAIRLKDFEQAVIVGSDRELYVDIDQLPHRHLNRVSGPGRNIAILGSVMLKKAVNSEELKGNYLRAPDIGASIG